MSRNVRKRTFVHLHLPKTQISLRIRAVWTEFLWFVWRNFALLAIQNEHSEYSDQSVQMRRLIWIFAGRTCPKLRSLTLLRRLLYIALSIGLARILPIMGSKLSHRRNYAQENSKDICCIILIIISYIYNCFQTSHIVLLAADDSKKWNLIESIHSIS